MRTPRLFLIWGFLTGIAAGIAQAAPPPSIAVPVGEARDKQSFTFRVDAPAPVLSNLPDGTTSVRVPGLDGHESRPGVPDLPFSVFRVALPPGVTPRLVLGSVQESKSPGKIPQAVPALHATLDDETGELQGPFPGTRVRRDKSFDPDPAVFHGNDLYPRELARLGTIGVFRDQRYVEVIVSPVRFDPTLRGLRVAASLTVTIEFEGDTGARTPQANDPRIESLYRSMFVNYAQGTTFRFTAEPSTTAATKAPTAPQAGPRYRIRVRANGMIRLDSSTLAGTGFESQPLSTYKLTSRGSEVPLLVYDANSNDQLDAGDYVQFYGQALDDDPKTVLNTDIPDGTSIYELRDYSDENIYFLTAEPGARSRLTERSAPANLSTPADKFDAVAHVETDNAFRPLGSNDPWYWAPSQTYPSQPGSASSRTQSVPLPGLAPGNDPVRVLVRLRGLTEDATTLSDHRSKITLLTSLTQLLCTNNDDGTFDGRTVYTHDFTCTYQGAGPWVTNPSQVMIDALQVNGAANYKNNFILDFIELHYKRTFQASGDTLTFDYPDGDAELQITGLTTNVPEVWEVTGRVDGGSIVAPVRVTGATVGGAPGNYSVRFHMSEDPSLPAGTLRRFVVTGSSGVAVPAAADFTADTVSDLLDTSNQADLIVIAHPTVLGATATPILNSLLAWKLANLGITSKVVWIQDVYDEFNNGLASPQAIKSFLSYAMSSWSGRKPAWVLLIGDGSYDSKYNDTSVPPSNFVPTQILFKDDPAFGYYASDSLLADVVGGDVVPDLMVGRISTRTDAQSATVLNKMLTYAQNPPTGQWRHHAVFVSDRGKNYDPAEAQEWEDTNTTGRNHLKIPPWTQRTMRYWTDYCGSHQSGCTQGAADSLRADIKKAVNGTDGISDGASIMQYTGHGNFNVWSDDAFFAEGWSGIYDVSGPNGVSNGMKMPWLIVHNCLSAGFEDTNDVTLGEGWLKKSGGGAIAVYAPSGLTDGYSNFTITDMIWGTLFGPTQERTLGTAAAAAQNYICGIGVQQACQNYVLLGDPTTQMVFPTVQPASNLQASAGNAQVSLSWTASSTSGATYDVYRVANDPSNANTYVKVNSSPVVGTTYNDITALNATTYYYYVVALDASFFESAWSNFNSDCAISGPDCVTARPLNPNPPGTPTGVIVVDLETGNKLNVSWNPVPEQSADLDHYTLWWGTQPGSYTSSVNAHKGTSYGMTSLNNGTRYYVAVTATNTSNHTSGYSTEASGVPTLIRGLRSPDFIGNLTVSKSVSGTDAVLVWGAITTDIFGKPATIASYEVFRGTTPTFMPTAGTKIGQPTSPTFTDVGAIASGTPYYYLVRAIDASGNVGGLGNQLPNGIDFMTVSKTPDGVGGFTLGFSWPAVTTDFDGNALKIDHYEVYSANHVFSRSDVNGMVPMASPTVPSFSVSAPVASQYYSVLAVDARGNKSTF